MAGIQLDHIVASLSADQTYKLAELHAKINHVTTLPSFEEQILKDDDYQCRYNSLSMPRKTGEPNVEGSTDSHTHPEDEGQRPSSEPLGLLKWDVSVVKTKDFNKAVGDLSPQKLREFLWKDFKHDDPDAVLVRYLEARDWNVDAALLMICGAIRWKREMNIVDGLMGGGELHFKETAENSTNPEERKVASEVMDQFRSGRTYSNGVDKQGRPVLFSLANKYDPSAQCEKAMQIYTTYQTESARMLMRPPVTTSVIIFDVGGFTLANMDWNAIRFATAGLGDKYPEAVGATYVYRAPWYISGIWTVVKAMMPGKEAQKVTFVKDAKQLSQYIDLKYLPADMGGTEDFKWEYKEPVPGENDLMKDTARRDEILQQRQQLVDEYQELTIDWFELLQLEASRGGLQSVQTLDHDIIDRCLRNAKSPNVEEAQTKRREVMAKLRENYFVLDPYVRGKCNGDRLGVPAVGEQRD